MQESPAESPAPSGALKRVVWLFGRSGAGKTTLARGLEAALRARGVPVFPLDGDDLRGGLCRDLGFGEDARTENHRRAAEVAKLAALSGSFVIAATMAPQRAQRNVVQEALGSMLQWVFVDAPLEVCAERDPKGLYARADAGKLKQLVDFPFDPPRPPDEDRIRIPTAETTVPEAIHALLAGLGLDTAPAPPPPA